MRFLCAGKVLLALRACDNAEDRALVWLFAETVGGSSAAPRLLVTNWRRIASAGQPLNVCTTTLSLTASCVGNTTRDVRQ